MEATDFETRYHRHLMLPEVGVEGQKRLLGSSVLIIGAGGLGSPVALYLAAAGVGHIGIVDNDNVDLSNLQRQIIHNIHNVGQSKTSSAQEKIRLLNTDVKTDTYNMFLDASNARAVIDCYDVVVDCTDNAASKFLINDVCVASGKTLIHGAINRYSGNVMTITPGNANLRDLFPTPPQSPQPSAQYGLLGVIAGVVGCIQAAEVLKALLGIGDLLTNQVLTVDLLTMTFTKFAINK